jgi:phospholipid/cholesterol/gamma-HCH transport system substrate-binding protein
LTLPLGLKHTKNLMKFRVRFAHQIVGVFVLLAILAVAAILILLGINQRWFAKDYYYWSVFKSAGGLSVGMPIRLKGFEIGKISKISLTNDNLVEIEFYIMDTYYDKVLPNSVLELSSNPLGLGGGMFFHPGKGPAEPLPEFSYIPSMDLEEGKELVESGLVDRSVGEDPIGEVIASLSPILVQVDSTLQSIEQMVQSLDDSITGVGPGPLTGVIVELETVAGQINDVLDELEMAATNINTLTEGMTDPTGLAKKLLDPKGSMATLLDDDNELYIQIVKSVEDLNRIIDELGDFVAFVNTTQPQISGILEKGKDTLDQGRDVLEAVKNNPLIRGGVPERLQQPTTFQSFRDEDF